MLIAAGEKPNTQNIWIIIKSSARDDDATKAVHIIRKNVSYSTF